MQTSWIVCLALLTGLSHTACAALGGDLASIEADRKAVQGKIKVTEETAYSVHEIKSGEHILREFVGADGKVFAVTWRGPTSTEMPLVLGQYMAEYRKARAANPIRAKRGPTIVRSENAVVEQTGRIRDLRGKAYLPKNFPPGVSAGDIR